MVRYFLNAPYKKLRVPLRKTLRTSALKTTLSKNGALTNNAPYITKLNPKYNHYVPSGVNLDS
jgi:hypothetical protein